jgi:hypothetical protein
MLNIARYESMAGNAEAVARHCERVSRRMERDRNYEAAKSFADEAYYWIERANSMRLVAGVARHVGRR